MNRPSVSTPSQTTAVLFAWFIAAVVCSLGSKGAQDAVLSARFLLLSCALLAASAVVAVLVPRLAIAASAAAFFGLLVLAAIAFPTHLSERAILIDLFYIIAVSTPAFLRLWDWRLQTAAGLAAFASLSWTWLGALSWPAAQSLSLLGVCSAIAGIVSYANTREQSAGKGAVLEERLLDLDRQSDLVERVWGTVLLQVGLLAIWIFLDIALLKVPLFSALVTKIYALLSLVFASLLLRSIRFRFASTIVALTTIGLGALITSAASGSLAERLFPVLYLALTTVHLPWRLEVRIAVAWGLWLSSAVTGFVIGAYEWEAVAVARYLTANADLLALLAITLGLSVALAHFLRLRATAPALGLLLTTPTADERQLPAIRRALAEERMQHILLSLGGLGIAVVLTSSFFFLSIDPADWKSILLNAVSFAALWWGLRFFCRKDLVREENWFLAAVLAILFLVWPAMLFVFLPLPRSYWFFWPVVLFISLGLTPWRAREALPLVMVAAVLSFQVLGGAHASGAEIVTFCGFAVLTIYFAMVTNGGFRESYFLEHFEGYLTGNRAECQQVLAEALLQLFSGTAALLAVDRQNLELLRGARVLAFSAGEWPLWELAQRPSEFVEEGANETFRWYHWLPQQWGLVDTGRGYFAPRHGWLIQVRADRTGEPFLIFLALQYPFWFLVQKRLLQVAKSLIAMTVLRLEALEAHRAGLERSRAADLSAAEREYELSAMVHDINNTVQDLTLLCESTLEGEGSREVPDEHMRRIVGLARSMATVVSDAKRRRELERLQDLSPREVVEVNGVFEEIVSFARLRAERRRITVDAEPGGPKRVWVRVSAREHLETILRNLLNNAILYSSPGSSVRATLCADDSAVHIAIADNGPGLSAEECEAIFASGFRGRSGSSQAGGLGVGLAQSRRVTESAGGTLTASSPGIGKGSTFTVSLPRVEPAAAMQSVQPWALLVDDQPALTEFYSRLVKALNLTAAVAHSVADALALVKERGRPTFVLTDIHLGAGSGIDLIRFLRQECGVSLPILVVSALSDRELEHGAREAGASDFMAKPVGQRALFARIQSLLYGACP